MPLTFTFRGQEVEANQILACAPKKKAGDGASTEPYHKGFFVEGYPPRCVAEAEAVHREELARWEAMSGAERAAMEKAGNRYPGQWSEESWIAKHKPKRLSKLYGTPLAADDFAAIAARQGFTHVAVKEAKRGKGQ
jgi:hypothetical protein